MVDLDPQFKKVMRNESATLTITMEIDTQMEIIHASGNPRLELTHSTDMVVRKSDFVSNRTLAIRADKIAKDFAIDFVKKLQNPKQQITITLTVETP